jgi:hypothetical protein
MKIAILKSPAFAIFVFAALVTTGGFWCFSVSSDNKDGPFPLLLLVSVCLICLGGIIAFIALMVMLGEIFDDTDIPQQGHDGVSAACTNHPAAANPAMATGCRAEARCRRVAGRKR